MKRSEGDVQVDEQSGDEPREKGGRRSYIIGFLLALVVLPPGQMGMVGFCNLPKTPFSKATRITKLASSRRPFPTVTAPLSWIPKMRRPITIGALQRALLASSRRPKARALSCNTACNRCRE